MATAQKLSIVTANETAAKPAAKKTPARKPAAKKTPARKPAPKWNQALFQRIVDNAVTVGNADEIRAKLESDIKKFREMGIKLGIDRRTCAISQEFFAAFLAQGVAEKTATNYLSGLRESINKGVPYSSNPSRAKAQARKEAQEKEAKTKKGTAANAYKDAGTVLDALATAIKNVKKKAGAALWERALAMAPDGFDFALADFLEFQGEAELIK